jgi:RNA-binding protein YlmH
MDKKSFLNAINFEDKNLLSNVYDKIKLAEKISKPVFTNEFYPPNVWKVIHSFSKSLSVNIYSYGVFEDSERRLLCFSMEKIEDYPVKLLKIHNKSKFEALEHRDYLGAIMAMGIKREKFGDLVLDGDGCYAAVSEDITDYIICNLNAIGRCPCSVEVLEDYDLNSIGTRFECFIINSTSMRLDCVISSLCNLSRSKAVDYIQSGKVLVDYVDIQEKDKLLEKGAVITARGYGKFKLVEELGSTQRGRLKLSMKKYI